MKLFSMNIWTAIAKVVAVSRNDNGVHRLTVTTPTQFKGKVYDTALTIYPVDTIVKELDKIEENDIISVLGSLRANGKLYIKAHQIRLVARGVEITPSGGPSNPTLASSEPSSEDFSKTDSKVIAKAGDKPHVSFSTDMRQVILYAKDRNRAIFKWSDQHQLFFRFVKKNHIIHKTNEIALNAEALDLLKSRSFNWLQIIIDETGTITKTIDELLAMGRTINHEGDEKQIAIKLEDLMK